MLDLNTRQLRDAIDKSTLSHLQVTDELNAKIINLQTSLNQERDSNYTKFKQLKDESNRQLSLLQKDLMIEQSQGDLLREQDTEQRNKIQQLESSNEELQKQILIGLETIQELKAQNSSAEIKQAATVKEYYFKIRLAEKNELQAKESLQAM